MKKIITILIIFVLILSGCGKNPQEDLTDAIIKNMDNGTIKYDGNPEYLSNAISLNFQSYGLSESDITNEYIVNVVATSNQLGSLFQPIVANPEVLPEEISILYNFVEKIPEYQNGEIEISWDEKNAVTGIVFKYLDNESATKLISQIENTCKINMINDTESDWVATTGILPLTLGTPYVNNAVNNYEPINGVQACYQYTGEPAYIQFNAVVPPEVLANPEYTEADNPVSSYGVYDDYQDCLIGKESVSNVEMEQSNYALMKDGGETGKQEANGEIEEGEANEVALVQTGQYISMNNIMATVLTFAPSEVVEEE